MSRLRNAVWGQQRSFHDHRGDRWTGAQAAVVRPRWRRKCDCVDSPREVTAPPPARLFIRTPYGTTVWACVLFERYVCRRPLNRVAVWLSDQGLPISPGTLGDSMARFAPLFEPLAQAILAYQNEAAVRHGDETGWRIQSLRQAGRSGRAWLWVSVTAHAVYFHIDPSRSAEAALKVDYHPEPRLAPPGHRAPSPARRLDRALPHHARAHRDVRGDPALHRRGLQGFGMDPRRHYPGTRALRPLQTVRQAEEGHLAAPPPKRLEANTESVRSLCVFGRPGTDNTDASQLSATNLCVRDTRCCSRRWCRSSNDSFRSSAS